MLPRAFLFDKDDVGIGIGLFAVSFCFAPHFIACGSAAYIERPCVDGSGSAAFIRRPVDGSGSAALSDGLRFVGGSVAVSEWPFFVGRGSADCDNFDVVVVIFIDFRRRWILLFAFTGRY